MAFVTKIKMAASNDAPLRLEVPPFLHDDVSVDVGELIHKRQLQEGAKYHRACTSEHRAAIRRAAPRAELEVDGTQVAPMMGECEDAPMTYDQIRRERAGHIAAVRGSRPIYDDTFVESPDAFRAAEPGRPRIPDRLIGGPIRRARQWNATRHWTAATGGAAPRVPERVEITEAHFVQAHARLLDAIAKGKNRHVSHGGY